jgi:hypothetical protein
MPGAAFAFWLGKIQAEAVNRRVYL